MSNKWATLSRKIKDGTANFFGVKSGQDESDSSDKWTNRRYRMLNSNLMGDVKNEKLRTTQDELDGFPQIIDPLNPQRRYRYPTDTSSVFRSQAAGSRSSLNPTRSRRKSSVFHMTLKGISNRVNRSQRRPGDSYRTRHSRSFAPASLADPNSLPPTPFAPITAPPGVMEGEHPLQVAVRQSQLNESDERTPFLASGGHMPPGYLKQMSVLSDEVFFDQPHEHLRQTLTPLEEEKSPLGYFQHDMQGGGDAPQIRAEPPQIVAGMDEIDAVPRGNWMRTSRLAGHALPSTPGTAPPAQPLHHGIKDIFLNKIMDMNNTDRRKLGQGCIGRLLNRRLRTDIDPDVRAQLDDLDDHRPFFTYWMTFVQLVIFIVSVAVYGIAPIGIGHVDVKGPVLKPNLAIEITTYKEYASFWIGPRQADLIHLGAKYSPCMRRDENVEAALSRDKETERGSACCISNDMSGCHQATRDKCSITLATWRKWDGTNNNNQRTSGSVCGLDPDYCKNPASSTGFEWPDDITQWPICKESLPVVLQTTQTRHLTCPLSGQPCCYGIQGQCMITTREHCNFVKGYFHEEAHLCSQVNCMGEICGMIPFAKKSYPDQFYRLFTSLFLHAGVFHLVITILVQWFVMRDVEKLTGCIRLCIIYFGSGIAGNLASAIFLPYLVEVGPSGAQFGLLGCMVVEVIHSWPIQKRPVCALMKLLAVLLAGIVVGFLPWIDNYAHVIGFAVGFMLSFAVLPYINFGRRKLMYRVVGVVVCLLICIGLFILLIILFYVAPIYQCDGCQYFTCIPITPTFCDLQQVEIRET